MDIFFQDPSEIPLPPAEVRIRELSIDVWPDFRRLKVYLEVDPFQKPPNADVFVRDAEGTELSQASIIEPMTRIMEITMHLRQPAPDGEYSLQAILYYSDPLPEPPEEGQEQQELKLPEAHEIDRKTISFKLPSAQAD